MDLGLLMKQLQPVSRILTRSYFRNTKTYKFETQVFNSRLTQVFTSRLRGKFFIKYLPNRKIRDYENKIGKRNLFTSSLIVFKFF